MSPKPYAAASAAVLAVVAIGQLTRALNGWPVQVADWQVPVSFSWVAFAVAGALAVWGLRVALR